MARKKTETSDNRKVPALLVSREEAKEKLSDRILKGLELKQINISSFEHLERIESERTKWSKYNSDLLLSIFDSDKIADEYEGYAGFFAIGGQRYLQSEIKELHEDIQSKVDRLESIIERLNLFPLAFEDVVSTIKKEERKMTNEIFIVHGHDDAAKNELARLIERLGYKPIILHEQPNQGRTIMEKFEKNSDVPYAIVLLTPDDIGASKNDVENLKHRARQNVILELGFYWGKLGRDRVSVLYKGDIELPSDILGLLYIQMDTAEGWKVQLAKELKNTGFAIDLNKLL
jgi:predicted nucleotide-binding protein